MKEADAVREGEVEGLEEKVCEDVSVLMTLLVLVALTWPVTLEETETLAESKAEAVSVADAEEQDEEE